MKVYKCDTYGMVQKKPLPIPGQRRVRGTTLCFTHKHREILISESPVF